ncbi:MAG: hypothetical protein ABS884_02760 [Solibacillus isronensis]
MQKQSEQSDKQVNALADSESNFRSISETYLKIHQYELFYRDNWIRSKEAVKSSALSEAISKFTLIDYLQQQNITLSDEKRQIQLKILDEQITYDMQNPLLKIYFEKMFQELDISKQDYIEEYLLVNKEHDILYREMHDTGKGLVLDEWGTSSYPVSDQEELYTKKMGISFDYLEYLAESEFVHIEPSITDLELPFTVDSYHFKFAKTREGGIVLTSRDFNIMGLTDEQNTLIHEVSEKNNLQELARYNFSQYKEALQQEAALGNENAPVSNELLELFIVVERSLDMELDEVANYQFGKIPSYDNNQLRRHKDITLQLYEYENYYLDENVPGKSYAYRIANEEVGAMYGLLNYLKQDFEVELDEAARSNARLQLEKSLDEQMKNPYFKKYMDDILQTFDIPLSTYIDDYLLLKEEYKLLLQLMKDQNIGLDHKGRYNKGWIEARYRMAADFTWEDKFEKMWSMDDEEIVEPLEPQPDLSFPLPVYTPQIGINKEGQYAFTSISTLPFYLTDELQTLFDLLAETYELPVLSRYSITQYIDKLDQLKADETKKKQLLEILDIYKNTIIE